jgi:hypothetical protein
MELLAQELRVRALNPLLVSAVTHHLRLITSTLRLAKERMPVNKPKSLNQQPVKLQGSNDPGPTAPHRHPRTQPAASVSLSLLLNSQAVPQRLHQVDRLLVKARPQPALELHQSVPVPVAPKHQTQP